MGTSRRSLSPVPPWASRIVHGPEAKSVFNRSMEWVAGWSPAVGYLLRTSLREAAFPFRPETRDAYPKLRDDIPAYAGLFEYATENFEKIVSRFPGEIRWPKARVYNGFFETIDAELYYSTIRFFGPKRIVEVGAGNSTWFARDALRTNGSGEIWAVDPSPRLPLPRDCIHLPRRVQDLDVSLFHELRAKDILFIDSSHSQDEARYLTERVYPILRPGVLIHHHDVLFPFLGYGSFIPDWANLGEQEVVLGFLVDHQDSFEVLTSSAFAWYENPEIVLRLIPSKSLKPLTAGGSIWIRKKA